MFTNLIKMKNKILKFVGLTLFLTGLTPSASAQTCASLSGRTVSFVTVDSTGSSCSGMPDPCQGQVTHQPLGAPTAAVRPNSMCYTSSTGFLYSGNGSGWSWGPFDGGAGPGCLNDSVAIFDTIASKTFAANVLTMPPDGVTKKISLNLQKPASTGPFTTLGSTSGLNSCLCQVEVSSYDIWTKSITPTSNPSTCGYGQTFSCGMRTISGTATSCVSSGSSTWCPCVVPTSGPQPNCFADSNGDLVMPCSTSTATPTPAPTPSSPLCGQTSFTYSGTCSGHPYVGAPTYLVACISAADCQDINGNYAPNNMTTDLCNCPSQTSIQWGMLSAEQRAQCLPCASPTPTPTPMPGCDLSTGGEGRACNVDQDCCGYATGARCAYAGRQPFKNYRDCSGNTSCVSGPRFKSNEPGGYPIAAGGQAIYQPQKVCVPSAASIPTAANILPPISIPITDVNQGIVKYDTDFYLRCMLESWGPNHHRKATGCSCETGYAPAVILKSQYEAVAFAPTHKSKLNALWAQIVSLVRSNPKVSQKVSTKIADLIPNAHACSDFPALAPNTSPPQFPHQMDCSPNGGNAGLNHCCCAAFAATLYGVAGFPSRDACICARYPNDIACEFLGSAATPTPSGPSATIKKIYTDTDPVEWKSTTTQNWGSNTALLNQLSTVNNVLVCAKADCPAGSTFDPNNFNSCICTLPQVYNPATNACDTPANNCPTGWSNVDIGGGVLACRPNVGAQFYRDPTPNSKYPICGAGSNDGGRLPMKYDQTSLRLASSGLPNLSTAMSYTSNGVTSSYAYSKPDSENGGSPLYLYQDLTHCGCVGGAVPSAPVPAADFTQVTGFYPDLYDKVNSRGSDGKPNIQVAPITIARDPSVDGRDGAIYAAGNSRCDCPNINEKIEIDANGRAYCKPRFDLSFGHVAFKSQYVHAIDSAFVMTGFPQTYAADGTTIVSKVKLATQSNPEVANATYNRGIWRCEDGFTENAGKCEFDRSRNKCSADAPVSPVSEQITGASDADRFNRTMNKRLACCMNHFKLGSSDPVKFDCLEYNIPGDRTFNQLWATSDDALDGGQMLAFVLTGANGKPVTGFYSLDGQRCNQYTEFTSTPYGMAKVNPPQRTAQGNFVSGTQDPTSVPTMISGTAIPQPQGLGKNAMLAGLAGKREPQTVAERLQCPILVRALAVSTCPQNPGGNAPAKTIDIKDSSGNLLYRRCSIASSVQVRLRVEQITEIAGQKNLEPFDTVIDKKNATAVSIDRIILKKYGNRCPPGLTRRGDACVY